MDLNPKPAPILVGFNGGGWKSSAGDSGELKQEKELRIGVKCYGIFWKNKVAIVY